MWTGVVEDVRYAVRQLARSPSIVLASVATLALAVGANTAIFSVVYGVLLRPLPYQDPDRLIRLYEEHPGGTPLVRDFIALMSVDAGCDSANLLVARVYREGAGQAEVGPMAGQVAQSIAQPRFAAVSISSFAMLALLLAAAGVYGVLSYHVSQRRREIDVRAALGATRGRLIALVLRHELGVTLAGAGAGMAAAALLVPLTRGLLFGIQPADPASFVAAPAVLLAVAVAACVLPARRAAAVDPAEDLRE